eukprot:NODE_2_length_91304_cov_0.692462.p33 type:complete len:303 gc:universal NODE_2_length_91304_cov_0.692462:48923-48015(-)
MTLGEKRKSKFDKQSKKRHFDRPNYNDNDLKQPIPRKTNLSIALPGSILDNAQSLQMKTILAGQIARACAIYRIKTIYIFNDEEKSRGSIFLTKILNYLETPQYLRKRLIRKSDDLRFVGLLPPLDCPHHFRKFDNFQFREGVVVEQLKGGCLVDVGLDKPIISDEVRDTDSRVTVKLMESNIGTEGTIVDRSEAENLTYWGYKIRNCANLTEVLQSDFDYILGTSERGENFDDIEIPESKNALICFGGVDGLEQANLYESSADDVKSRFSNYINIAPHQGSRTIRTEEAVLATLSLFSSKF